MTSFFNAIIIDNTLLFFASTVFALMWFAFPETVARFEFSRLKKFFV